MQALFSDSRNLFGFPDRRAEILVFDGAGFVPYRKLQYISNRGFLVVNEQSIDLYNDTMVFAGQSNVVPGIYQMKGSAICQAFVPAGYTPGVDANISVGFVKRGQSVGTEQRTSLYVGYFKSSDSSYHIEATTSNRQNNAVVKTLWHKINSDRLKRWYGIKLNLKPLGSCSVTVAYRTVRDASFTTAGTITSSNQDKPLLLTVQPRSKEIQFQLTYTTSTTSTPELETYDLLYDLLNSTR